MTPDEIAALRARHKARAEAAGFNVSTAGPDFEWEKKYPNSFSWPLYAVQQRVRQESQPTPAGWPSFGETTGFVPNVKATSAPPPGTVGTLVVKKDGRWGRFPGLIFEGVKEEKGGAAGAGDGGETFWKVNQLTEGAGGLTIKTREFPESTKGITWDFFIPLQQPRIAAAAAEASAAAALAKLDPGTPGHHAPSKPNAPAAGIGAPAAAAILPAIAEGEEENKNNGGVGAEGGLRKSRHRASRHRRGLRRSLRRSSLRSRSNRSRRSRRR